MDESRTKMNLLKELVHSRISKRKNDSDSKKSPIKNQRTSALSDIDINTIEDEEHIRTREQNIKQRRKQIATGTSRYVATSFPSQCSQSSTSSGTRAPSTSHRAVLFQPTQRPSSSHGLQLSPLLPSPATLLQRLPSIASQSDADVIVLPSENNTGDIQRRLFLMLLSSLRDLTLHLIGHLTMEPTLLQRFLLRAGSLFTPSVSSLETPVRVNGSTSRSPDGLLQMQVMLRRVPYASLIRQPVIEHALEDRPLYLDEAPLAIPPPSISSGDRLQPYHTFPLFDQDVFSVTGSHMPRNLVLDLFIDDAMNNSETVQHLRADDVASFLNEISENYNLLLNG